MNTTEIGYEERSLGALYFSFGIGLGTLTLRWVLFGVVSVMFGTLSLEQTIILNIFIGSFIGSVLYNLRVDLSIELITRYLVGRKFKGENGDCLVDIAYVDIMYHAWESELWEAVTNDTKLAIKDAVRDVAVQSLLWNIKAGIFSGISVALVAVALHDLIPLFWFIILMGIALAVFVVPIHRNWDRVLIVHVAKMKWYREGIVKVIHKKDAGRTLDLGISPEKAQKLGADISGVLAEKEYERFKRHSEILTKTIRKFGDMTAKTYRDSVLASYLYRAVVRDFSQSNVRTKHDYRQLFEEIRRIFKMTDSLDDSPIDWMPLGLKPDTKPLLFFDTVPVDIFTGTHVLDRTDILRDISEWINEAPEDSKIEHLNSIGNSLLHYKAEIPRELKKPIFNLLNNDEALLERVEGSIIAGILKNGLHDEFLKKITPSMVKRFVEITSSQEQLEYLRKEALEHMLLSIYILSGVQPDTKKEIEKHTTLFSRIGMDELVDALKQE